MKLPLVNRLYKAHYPAGKAKSDELVIAGYIGTEIAAVVRFRSLGEYRLLTGMLVVPNHRGQGLGHALLEYCQKHILDPHDYCFAYPNLEAFYAQHGFTTLDKNALPNDVKNLFERYARGKPQLVAMGMVAANLE
ncbi:GNAT family N-acetyltransferase [Vibrio cholerae]